MFAIYKKELKAYFYSPLAYVLIGIYMLIFSLFLRGVFTSGRPFMYGAYLYQYSFLLIFILPTLTMRAFAEEKKSGTDVLLMTSPVSVPGIVLGKYLASLTVFLLMTILTLIYPALIIIYGNLNIMPAISCYIGHILLGAFFVAFGIFTSSLTKSQVIAAVTGIGGLILIWFINQISFLFKGALLSFANWISFFFRFREFVQGLFSTRDLVFFLSLIGLFLLLTMIVIEKRRWSQG
ncbi:MAG TPA: ABC transporter permease [Ruminiclostridium sp.]|jgi:ABC-2 type transport system permease protein|uniref:ABC transporter permease n=1 Tax=Acetivibrio saccincola TaxID=1677857 RepID=A0A2K9E562_9FIRM|nr:ABC transporter permease [Acetivibrio saccincola]HAA42998.1 ABC transporter permease [Ruminiclostridium sp.]AUG58519.1 ABC-2 family transporter protein [Acetivibrio saccincola]NLW27200.1 ABC transporter permease subunit [Acetivibrio saccincola]PQQ66283.1 ABC transporter permease [Acetivibrio saccincola]HOA96268.1 ABC transporter permease subunit [Acetivibrio saccincola]